ncbi:hypothetical protein [Magnetospirillum sp. 64-120]|uniref:hypothetical protein n=1 Tax=Magnetospirillum sp. 64-120 TaxID=1895778 RepID=UPI000929C32C|nr:hypothetical protein [Magnetospirillum sp. 64-120]OJX75921.1 MAG: hypothetical protein BGO92_15260 [Magnetospirillum sp. 64-120]
MTAGPILARFVVPVWGRAYIDLMTRVMIPSLLAPNNIPAVSGGMKVEFIFVTQAASRPDIESAEAVIKLSKYANIDFLYIDKYFSNNYGMILTRAYFDSIIKYADSARDYHYFFFNVDTVISNGSLLSVLKYLEQGKSLLFSPGLRVNTQQFFEDIADRREQDSTVLSIGSRELAAIALKNIHATVLAQRLTHQFSYLLRPYQFYWQERPEVMHISAFLMANICFKPTAIPTEPTCFIDYCISEAFCPGQEITVIQDSDEFLLIEPQAERWMKDELRCGHMTEDECIAFFSNWVTPQHIVLGQPIVTIHADELTDGDRRTAAESARQAQRMARQMKPQPYRDHPYWKAALAAEQQALSRQKSAASDTSPQRPTLAAPITPVPSLKADRSLPHRVYNMLFGTAPKPRWFHPFRVQFDPILSFFARHQTARKLVLLLDAGGNTWYVPENDATQKTYRLLQLDTLLEIDKEKRTAVGDQLMEDMAQAECIFIYVPDRSLLEHPALIKFLETRLPRQCQLGVCYAGELSAFVLAHEDSLQPVQRIMQNGTLQGKVTFSGHPLELLTARLLSQAILHLVKIKSAASAATGGLASAFYLLLAALSVAASLPFVALKTRFVKQRAYAGANCIFFELAPMVKSLPSESDAP